MSDVPCGTCTACCRAFDVWMQPGDRAEQYRTVAVPGRLWQRKLERNADGSCVYVGPTGCSIYEYRPLGCRAFDCRKWVDNFPGRSARRDAGRQNPAAMAVITRGLELKGP